MRFSDMMGSGDDKSSKRSTPSESEALIADALAPYLDTRSTIAAPPEPPVVAQPVEAQYEPEAPFTSEAPYEPEAAAPAPPLVAIASVVPVAPVAPMPSVERVPVAPVAPVLPVVPVAPVPVAPVAPRDPIAATIADFAPISDDLLPRRR